MPSKPFYQFINDQAAFVSTQGAGIKTIYAPLCGADATGLKSAITPYLGGDIKIDKFHYLTKPASREDLRYPLRNFFVYIKNKGVLALSSDDHSVSKQITVGPLWHQLTAIYKKAGLKVSALNFVPSSNEPVELMRIMVTNISKKTISFTPTAAVPIFGRSLANKHDHEHVTALLNRIIQTPEGVLVLPTMAFNEEGHRELSNVYFVYGVDDKQTTPLGTFPTVDSFYGDKGNITMPQAVLSNAKPLKLSAALRDGKEAMGALRFKDVILEPKSSKEFLIVIGAASSSMQAKELFKRFNSVDKFNKALEANKVFWHNKSTTITCQTADNSFNQWMRWVTIQPVLRRIFGCSFLPDHDYGKGGKGWRDLWQDLLSLILIEPHAVREGLLNNFVGVRIDGSNATIIGTKPGEFLADRNAITRVWMDHGCWPFLTTLLYINQTGDFDILLEQQTYFRDPQLSRTFEKDIAWVASYGNRLLDKKGQVFKGTIIEHLLVQHLTQFFNVGAHNIIRLESADWNDGLDMAFDNGESVAFSALYAGNLLKLADLLEALGQAKKIGSLRLAKEVVLLLDTLGEKPINYDHWQDKKAHLFGTYFNHVQPALSAEHVEVSIALIAQDLRKKGQWLNHHIRTQEAITVRHAGQSYQWFNGYYDNKSRRVEGLVEGNVRMTLTGQVFTLLSGMADEKLAAEIIKSVRKFLRDKALGGYRLNTDFGVRHYLDLGRAFGFAYGTKENGAFFSHMNVMYAYALYSRGFVHEGFDVINSIYSMAINGEKSKIYPGIPEYFDSNGQGMYHYLTGSASWLVMTVLTQSFGVRGAYGDLCLDPKLVKQQFNSKGVASITCQFASNKITVQYNNPKKLDYGKYAITAVFVDGKQVATQAHPQRGVILKREQIQRAVAVNVLLDAQ